MEKVFALQKYYRDKIPRTHLVLNKGTSRIHPWDDNVRSLAPTQKAGPQGDRMRDTGFHWETKKLLMECETLTGKVHLDCGAARVTEGPGKVNEMQGVAQPQAGKGGVEGG